MTPSSTCYRVRRPRELTRNRPHAEEGADDRVHSPREYFHAYLHSPGRRPGAAARGLPWQARARPRALRGDQARPRRRPRGGRVPRLPLPAAHPDAPAGGHRAAAALARRRAREAPAPRRRRRTGPRGARPAGPGDPAALPDVGDLARSARFRWFEAPIVEAAREAAYAEVRDQLEYLSEHPDAGDYAERVEALVASPEPLVRFLAERSPAACPRSSRWSRCSPGGTTGSTTSCSTRPAGPADGRPCVWANTRSTGRGPGWCRRSHPGDLEAPARSWRRSSRDPAGQDAVVDLYLAWRDAPSTRTPPPPRWPARSAGCRSCSGSAGSP